MVKTEIDTEQVKRAFDRFPDALKQSINIELKQIGATIEERAFKEHKHQERSGDLQSSPFASVGSDGLTVTLDPENRLPYAEWIHEEWGDPFLERAVDKERPDIIKRLAETIAQVIRNLF